MLVRLFQGMRGTCRLLRLLDDHAPRHAWKFRWQRLLEDGETKSAWDCNTDYPKAVSASPAQKQVTLLLPLKVVPARFSLHTMFEAFSTQWKVQRNNALAIPRFILHNVLLQDSCCTMCSSNKMPSSQESQSSPAILALQLAG